MERVNINLDLGSVSTALWIAECWSFISDSRTKKCLWRVRCVHLKDAEPKSLNSYLGRRASVERFLLSSSCKVNESNIECWSLDICVPKTVIKHFFNVTSCSGWTCTCIGHLREKKKNLALFFSWTKQSLARLQKGEHHVCTGMSVFHLTEEDHDADETEDSSEDQAPNTQSVVICREKSMKKFNVKSHNSF